MVTFNELCFSDDMQSLSLECSVEEGEQIERIYLEYYKNRNASGAPSPKALLIWSAPHQDNDEPGEQTEEAVTSVEVTVDASQLSYPQNGVDDFEGGVFYILVHWKDTYDDDHYDVGIILDWSHVYKVGMDCIADFVYGRSKTKCDPPKQFEQFVIVIHALQLAIETKDMDMIDTLWSRFISFSSIHYVSSCNCR